MTSTDPAQLQVSVGGPLPPEVMVNIVEVRVELGIAVADRAIVRIADPEFTIIDGAHVDVGQPLEVKLSAPGSPTPVSVFKGEVVSVEGDIGPNGAFATVVGFDKSHRMRRKTTIKSFTNVTVSDVASTIASSNGLTMGTSEAPGSARQDILQYSESDWALLQRLCNEADCDWDVDDGKLYLRKRSASEGPTVTLTIGEGLRAFRPRLSGAAQIDTVHVHAWDPTQKQTIVGQAQPKAPVGAQSNDRTKVAGALGGGDIVIVDHPVESSGDADIAAQSAADRLASTVVEATGVAVGNPQLTPGDVVALKGVGKRFSGNHRIVAVTHVYRGATGYETRFTLGAGGRPLIEEFGGRPQKNGFANHLVIGLVTNNNDTQGWGRVKVKYPALDGQTESVWARIGWPAAGSNRGIVAIPEVNDEVIVGFELGDIERPMVLGVLFNGKDKPGGFLTPQSNKPSVAVQMPRDLNTKTDGKITTTAQQDITLESTQGPITVKADQQGMTVQAQQDINIKSDTGGLNLTATTGTQIKDDAQITINANGTISIKSSGSLQISGSAIQVSATGILQLSGSQVMIG